MKCPYFNARDCFSNAFIALSMQRGTTCLPLYLSDVEKYMKEFQEMIIRCSFYDAEDVQQVGSIDDFLIENLMFKAGKDAKGVYYKVVDGYSLDVFSLVCKYRLGISLELLQIYQYLDHNFEFCLS